MANPKQLFRGHLVQQHGDTLRGRTPPPPPHYSNTILGKTRITTAAPPSRSGRLPPQPTPAQSGNINNASTNEHSQSQHKQVLDSSWMELSWRRKGGAQVSQHRPPEHSKNCHNNEDNCEQTWVLFSFCCSSGVVGVFGGCGCDVCLGGLGST